MSVTTTVRVRGTLISIFKRKETTHFIETFLSFRGRSSCMESLMTFNAEFNSFFDVGINAGLFSQANLACISKNWIYSIKLLWLFRCVLTLAGLTWKPLTFSQKKYPDFDPRKFGLFDENIIVLFNKWTHLPFHSTTTQCSNEFWRENYSWIFQVQVQASFWNFSIDQSDKCVVYPRIILNYERTSTCHLLLQLYRWRTWAKKSVGFSH